MWSAKSRAAQACLTGRQLWWSDGNGELKVTGHADTEEGWRTLEAELRSSSTKRLKLWLGGTLCRVALVAPAQGAKNRQEAEAAALAALVAMKKAETGDLAFYAARYGGGEPAPIAILPGAVQDKLVSLKALGIKFVACQPWWSAIDVARKMTTGESAPEEARELRAFYDGEAASVIGSQRDGQVEEAGTLSPVLALEEARRIARRVAAARSVERASLVFLSETVQDGAAPRLVGDFAFSNFLVVDEAI